MALPDPQSWADKWATRTQAASEDYRLGVERTDKDPTALAVAAGARYLANVQAAYTSGRWQRALQRAGKAGWQAGVAAKGVTNFSTGVAASKDKAAAAIAPVLSYMGGVLSRVYSMPAITDADRDNRMLTFSREMRKYKTGG